MNNFRNGKVFAGLFIFLGLMLLCSLISKGIYASKLPQVTVEKPKRMAISHEVEASGSVKPARELAKNVAAGLRVKEVLVTEGDQVEAGQELFVLDTAYIQDLVSQKELEAKKLELQIVTLQSNLELAGEEKTREMQRALEDGALALTEADKRLARAKEDLEYAERELALYVADTPESEDEEVWKSWEEGRKALAQKVLEAERALEDAQEAQTEAFLEAERGLEDHFSAEASDASLGVARMELQGMEEEIAKLKSLLNAEGKVLADAEGTVTSVSVRAGENTTDAAAVTFADAAVPLQFEAVLDREQKKYVEPGAEGELTFGSFLAAGGKAVSVTVDYLTELSAMPGSFCARMLLPDGCGTIGQSGTFTMSVQSESFSCCISMDAVHKDENQRSYVYVMEETDTILGKELVARKRMVEVLDSNDSYAALRPGVIDETDSVIRTATQPFEDGDVIRLKE